MRIACTDVRGRRVGVGGADGLLSASDADEQVEKLSDEEELNEQRVTVGG